VEVIMRVAICGAGIAGPTLAFWLERNGHEPTLIERAPEPRATGYVIDFWGLGYAIAERMGILPAVKDHGYLVREVRFVDERGRRNGGFSTAPFQRATGARFTSLPRGELSAIILRSLEGRVETRFSTTITGLDQRDDGVDATLSGGRTERFDLVFGAGGLHSPVRRIVFGPQDRFEVELGYRVAAFQTTGYEPRDELAYVSHAEPGRQVARFALEGDRTMFFFIFRDEMLPAGRGEADPRDILRSVFGRSGWECPQILAALPEDPADLYYDSVSQIRMPAWTQGRVALLGDAAACVSLLAGEGTGLAMLEAYVLAGELERAAGDHAAAFAAYEQRLRGFIAKKQKSAAAYASAFAPRTAFGLWFRNRVTNLFAIPAIADWFIGRDLKDEIELPDYEQAGEILH
jgi:2-polyprenyl-6-methoxyphenol hydroxylase-like FAD-dependent oxidoreductase